MTDHFEKAMQDIALKSAKNGGPTIRDVLDAMVAGNLDAEDSADRLHTEVKDTAKVLREEVRKAEEIRRKSSIARHKETLEMLSIHCAESELVVQEVAEIQEWRRKSSESCQQRIEAIVRAEHKERHDNYVASMSVGEQRVMDSLDSMSESAHTVSLMGASSKDSENWMEIMLAWKTIRWVLAVIFVAALSVGGNYIVTHNQAKQLAVTQSNNSDLQRLLLEAEKQNEALLLLLKDIKVSSPTPSPTVTP